MKYALQLYSIRDMIKDGDDMLKILADVKAAGYEGVEFAGFFGLTADVLRARLDELGLKCVGAHCGVGDFEPDKIDETINNAITLGTPQIGVGGGPTGTEKDLTYTINALGGGQKKADEKGIKVYFHNHTGEFAPTKDGDSDRTIFERLMDVCYIQVDTYWSFHAGIDTPAYLKDHLDRIVTIHLKDGIDGHPKALGEGQNDIPSIVKAADALGIEWAVVENDDPWPNGLDDVTRSINYLKSL